MGNPKKFWKGKRSYEAQRRIKEVFPKCFNRVEMVHGDSKQMHSVIVLTRPVEEMCLKVQVVDLPLWERPDAEVNLAPSYTNTHLSIIHTHTQHSAPLLGHVDGFGPEIFKS